MTDDGGSPILNYNIYIDDGLDGLFTQYQTTLLTWNSLALNLVKGRTYRLKYSSTNIQGESPMSPEVGILLAELPSAPSNIRRIDMASVTAGDVRISWALPLSQGGDPVIGFKLYVNTALVLDASTMSTLNEYTFTGLSVGETYRFSVTALNHVGESAPAYLDLIAASVPSKLAIPIIVISTQTTITLSASEPQFNGGSAVTQYVFARDNGPLTSFEP